MNIWSVCGFGICAVCVAVVLKQLGSPFHTVAAAAAGTAILAYVAVRVVPVLDYVRELAVQSGMDSYFAVAVKCLGIALVCRFSSEICRDCGENTVGGRIEFAGRAAILVTSLPLLKTLVSYAVALIGQ